MNSVYPGFEINIIPITSKHPKNQKYIQSLHKRPNAVDAFLCVDMMSQGHHFDDLTGIVMQRKTSSPVKYTQQIGRCMSVANFNDMFVLDLVGNFINDFIVENPLAAVYRQIAAHQLPGTRVGTDWRDAERARVHMSGHQVRYQLLLDKLRYAAEVSQYKGLSTLCKIYEIHPEVNLADVCKAQKINLGTALRFIAERGKLRDSDYVPEYDPTNNSTYQQRLADKYNYNGEMLRPSAILKHYPNISIATMRNWLRACGAISDVKEQLDTRYQKLYATPTVYEWLKPYKAYTDITQVITAKLWCRDADILYHGEQTKAYRVLSGIDADVVDFYNVVSHLTGDTSEAIDSNFDTVGTVFTFRGKVLNRRGIAYYLGVTESIVWNRTKGISRAEAEAVLRQFDKNTLRAVKTYIYHNRELDISTISETVGSKRTLVCQWLHGIPAGEDVSELLDAHIWCRDTTILYHGKATNACCVLRILNTDVVRFYRVVHSLEGDVSRTVDLAFSTTGKVYAFRDMVLNCAGIAYYLESHVSIIDRRLKGLSREDAEAVLREMDKHARRKLISYNYQGESLSASAISQRLGLSAQTLPRIIRTYEY